MFRHPKYYKELRKRNRVARNPMGGYSQTDQAISTDRSRDKSSVTPIERAPGPGPKQQAASAKQQASSAKLLKEQAASIKPQA
jgi:hypothetical protein